MGVQNKGKVGCGFRGVILQVGKSCSRMLGSEGQRAPLHHHRRPCYTMTAAFVPRWQPLLRLGARAEDRPGGADRRVQVAAMAAARLRRWARIREEGARGPFPGRAHQDRVHHPKPG